MAQANENELRQLRESEEKSRKAREELEILNDHLEEKIRSCTRELEEKHAQLIQAEKMASLGSLVAGVAHDINTPLGALSSNNDLLTRIIGKMHHLLVNHETGATLKQLPQLEQLFQQASQLNVVNKTASQRIVAIVNSLRKFARVDQSEMVKVDLHEGIDNTLTLLHHEIKNRIDIERDFGSLPLFLCHPNQINQVFMNILVNASQAIDKKGKITIKTWADKKAVYLRFTDTGHGIDPSNLAKIFAPGFTTKSSGIGTGLGLSIVYKLVKSHQGEIDVQSEVGKGTSFTLTLPIR